MTRLFFFVFCIIVGLVCNYYICMVFKQIRKVVFEWFFVKKKRNFLKNEKDIFESYFGVE